MPNIRSWVSKINRKVSGGIAKGAVFFGREIKYSSKSVRTYQGGLIYTYIVSDHSYDGAYPWHGETLQDLQAVPTNVLEPRPQGDHVDQQPSLTMTSGNQYTEWLYVEFKIK